MQLSILTFLPVRDALPFCLAQCAPNAFSAAPDPAGEVYYDATPDPLVRWGEGDAPSSRPIPLRGRLRRRLRRLDVGVVHAA